jgi:Mrp family chromosome partitioning ATPase
MKSNGRPRASVKANGNGNGNGHLAAKPDGNGSNGHIAATNGHSPAAPLGAPVQRRVRMRSHGEAAFKVFSSAVAGLVSKGQRTLMITSSGPGEGKSTIAATLARTLAQSGRMSVALVDADTFRPRIHELFQIENRRGLGELLHDVYHVDLSRENPDQFGVGDWIELVRAQSRTGKLQISEGSEDFSIVFNKGRVSSLFDHQGHERNFLGEMLVARGRISDEQRTSALRVQEEGSHPLGKVLEGLGYLEIGEVDAVLRTQLKERLHKILTMRQPRFQYSEMVEAYLPAAAGSPADNPEGAGVDRFVAGTAGDHLKQPYLSSQVPGYLKDTGMENLKVLTCGERAYDLYDAHFASPFAMILDRLAKRFDVVLVDSPPVAFDSATASLARAVDGVLLVVKANELNVAVIQQAKEHLVRSGANILGVVLNQVDLFKDEALPYYHSVYR